VAVAAADTLLALRCREMAHGQAEALMPMVEAAMREAALPVAALDFVAVTVGPGSFTGIRVGLAAAQGVALAAALPLLGVTGFEAVAACVDRDQGGNDPLLLVALESRRAELYVQVVARDGPLASPAAVPPAALLGWTGAICGGHPLVVAGDAAARAAAALAGRPATTVLEARPATAVGVVRETLRRWRRGERQGRTEPLYLRPPDVTQPGGSTATGAL
jgi:tRNA threonylcarbamoyladenosine biosynthesis protein TsaB